MRGVDFFCQSKLPYLPYPYPLFYTRFNKIPQPGDELQYGELDIRFLVDENMKNYYQVHDWMRELLPTQSSEFGYKRGEVKSQNLRTPVTRTSGGPIVHCSSSPVTTNQLRVRLPRTLPQLT